MMAVVNQRFVLRTVLDLCMYLLNLVLEAPLIATRSSTMRFITPPKD